MNKISNNIFYNTKLAFEIDDEPESHTISNNLFFNESSDILSKWSDETLSIADWSAFNANGNTVQQNYSASPSFEDINREDFRLKSDSPCIDNGIELDFEFDFIYNPILNLPDIGPFEYF